MNKDKYYFRLFSNCIPIKGYKESIVCDLQNNQYFKIPNILCEILEVNLKFKYNIKELKKHFKNIYSEGIDRFFDLFYKNNFGIYTLSPDVFESINHSFYTPYEISNAIIEVGDETTYDIVNIIYQLEKLGCEAIEIRYKTNMNIDELENILYQFRESRIKCFNLLIKHNINIKQDKIENLVANNKRINKIIIHSFLTDINETNKQNKRIVFTKEIISDNVVRNNIFFIVSMKTFCEAKNYNLGLNRKVCIDEFGYVKNYLNHKNVFGNINTNSIAQLIEDKEFQKKWHINNDLIEICKDCQYRYICLSTSDIDIRNNNVFKIDKCQFDPFNNYFINNKIS